MMDHKSQHIRSYGYQVMNGIKSVLVGSPFIIRHWSLSSVGVVDSACVISSFFMNRGLLARLGNDNDKLCCYKFDPFISPECCLIPNNLGAGLFMRIAPFNPERELVEELLWATRDHGKICHMTGASLCITVSSIKDMFSSCGVSKSLCNSMINCLHIWLFTNLARSGSEEHKMRDGGGIDLEDFNMDETTALAAVIWLAYKHITCVTTFLTGRSSDDVENKSVEDSLCSVIHLLLGKCISHWYKNGGIAFCMYKMVYILSTAKAVILSLSDGLSSEPNAVEAEKQYISCFFEFVCAGCMYEQNDNATKLSSCRKKIIQCCSSNKIMPDLVRRVLSHGEEPYKLMERALDDCCDVSDVKCFVGVKDEVVSKVMSIAKGVFYNYEICCSVDGCSSESNARSLTVSLELARVKAESEKYFMYRCRDYDSYILYGWIDCINEGADPVIIGETRLMEFINYLVEQCHYECSEFSLSEIASSIVAKARLCYSEIGDQGSVDSLMEAIGSLMKMCIMESEIRVFSVCKWLRISVGWGCGIVHNRSKIYGERFLRKKFPVYHSCMGMVLLPNEVRT